MAYVFDRQGSPTGVDADALELFKVKFATEVETSFKAQTIMDQFTEKVTIQNGKGYEFPILGDMHAIRHSPGTTLAGQKGTRDKRTINLDKRLVVPKWIPQIDILMDHTNQRSKYASFMAHALATQYDIDLMREVIKGARAPATWGDLGTNVDGVVGGSQIVDDAFIVEATVGSANGVDQAKALAAGIFEAAAEFDKKNIPKNGRNLMLRPDEYYVLFQNLDLINQWYGGRGSIAEGNILKIAGFNIIENNLLPSDNTDGAVDNEGDLDPHGVDASQTVAIAFTNESLGTVELQGIFFSEDFHTENISYLMYATYIVGHGYLRPEACLELKLDTLTLAQKQ